MAAKVFRGLLALLPVPIWACSCGVSPVQYCESAPDPSNQQQAIFVGVVREFYPKSHEQMTELWKEFYQSHPDLRSQTGSRVGRRIAGAPPDDQEFRREFIRFLWGNSLNSVEQEHWQRWSKRWLYDELGLYNHYRVRRAELGLKANPA